MTIPGDVMECGAWISGYGRAAHLQLDLITPKLDCRAPKALIWICRAGLIGRIPVYPIPYMVNPPDMGFTVLAIRPWRDCRLQTITRNMRLGYLPSWSCKARQVSMIQLMGNRDSGG